MGRCENRKPLGFDLGEAAVKTRMAETQSVGLCYDLIAAKLNVEGQQTRTGAKLHGVVVDRMLTGNGCGQATAGRVASGMPGGKGEEWQLGRG